LDNHGRRSQGSVGQLKSDIATEGRELQLYARSNIRSFGLGRKKHFMGSRPSLEKDLPHQANRYGGFCGQPCHPAASLCCPKRGTNKTPGGSVRFTLRMGSGPSHARSSSLPATSASTVYRRNQALAPKTAIIGRLFMLKSKLADSEVHGAPVRIAFGYCHGLLTFLAHRSSASLIPSACSSRTKLSGIAGGAATLHTGQGLPAPQTALVRPGQPRMVLAHKAGALADRAGSLSCLC
jgi:hypothetical protein